MYGWTINLLMDTEQDIKVANSNSRQNIPNLVWSSYDRFCMRRIDDFKDYFIDDEYTTQWTGSIQSLHLYSTDIKSEHSLQVNSNPKKDNFYLFDSLNPDKSYSLSMIVSLKIDEKVFFQNDLSKNEKIINYLYKTAKEVINDNPIEFFFSLGEEDIVLIVLGNSVDEFMRLIRTIRSINFIYNGEKNILCNFTNSFLIQNCKLYEQSVECKNSYARLYVALSGGLNESTFTSKLKNELKKYDIKLSEMTMTVGEYDVVIDLYPKSNGNSLFNLYSAQGDEGILNASSQFYIDNIKNSKTIWCINLDDEATIPEHIFEIKNIKETYEYNHDFEGVDREIKDFLKELNKMEKESDDTSFKYVYHNITYFLKEASLTLHSTTNNQWKYVVSKQIEAFINAYKLFDLSNISNENTYVNTELFISDLNTLINDMRNSFSNINRSHELFYHIPSNSLHYSGSFNSILLAYYNFINDLLKLAFKKPHNKNTKQANIVFFVHFGMTSKIQTKIYLHNYLNQGDTKLVGFELPYTALYDLKKHFIALSHEVYHFIAPYDREKRNIALENIWLQLFVKKEFANFVYSISDDNVDERELNELITLFFNETVVPFKSMPVDYMSYDYAMFNHTIQNELVKNNKDTITYYHTILQKFVDFCENNKKAQENYADSCKFITSIIVKEAIKKYSFSNNLNNFNSLTETKAVLQSIKECVCDSFMYVLSFKKGCIDSSEQYILYMLNFLGERRSNEKNSALITNRIGIFLDTIEYDIQNSKLESQQKKELKNILDDYKRSLPLSMRNYIKSLIRSDNFLYVTSKCYSKETFDALIDEINHIKNKYILCFNDEISETKFDTYISSIISLNNTFEIANENVLIANETIYDDNSIVNKNTRSDSFYIPTDYVLNIGDYLTAVRNIDRYTNDGKIKNRIWFRGICNVDYKLIPSLYVRLSFMKQYTNPYSYQMALLRQSYDNTKKYYGAFAKHETPVAARQSLMQHYGVPTNLLDFTTDPLSALYWALNPMNDEDKEKIATAVVYFFNPHKYQRACKYLHEKHDIEDSVFDDRIYAIRSHNCLEDEYIIKDTTDMHQINTINEIEKKQKDFDDNSTSPEDKEKMLYQSLPIPIVIPQKNDRILAQSGTFVAFNLSSIANGYGEDKYHYLALESIQKHYYELCMLNNEKPHELFLRRVLISPYSVDSIRDTLNRIFRYSRESVYPDLENLLKTVERDTFGY